MGSPPPPVGRLASFPTRLRLRIGPGPDGGVSRLKALRPHAPERSGMAAEPSAAAGRAIVVRIATAKARVATIETFAVFAPLQDAIPCMAPRNLSSPAGVLAPGLAMAMPSSATRITL